MKNSLSTLVELCHLVTDGKHGDCENQCDSGFYFLSAKDVRDGKLNYENARQITKVDFLDTHRRTQLAPNDIVISNSGTIGRMALVRFSPNTQNTTFQKSVAILKPKHDLVMSDWLYYYLLSELERLVSFASGTAQKNLLLKDLRAFSIKLAPMSTQRKIASILSAYDDLIENNTRRIAILEEMSQRLYKEWFVNFKFPGHETAKFVDSPLGMIPEGWRVGRLDDILVLQRGFDLPINNRLKGNIPVYAATGIVGVHNEVKVKGPGVLTGRSGSLGVVTYVHEDHWPLNTTLWVKCFVKPSPIFAYFTLRSIDFSSYNSGSAVPTLNRNDIHGLPRLLPSDDVINTFHSLQLPIFELVSGLQNSNVVLRKTRDMLLPKLISGELDVKELDIDTGEAFVES